MKIRILTLFITVFLAILGLPAQAHTVLSSSNPADNSIETIAPENIALGFSTEVRLTAFSVEDNDGKVIFGSTIMLQNLDTDESVKYKIVGKDEADLKEKLIYFKSPIGMGLIGKNKGDLVEIKTPAGVKNFEIKDVKYI